MAEARRWLDLVALDQDHRLVASYGRLTVQDVATLVVDEIHPSIVCIDSPSGWSLSGKSRQAERQYGVDESALPTLDRVDAALAALTGILALQGSWTGVGDAD